MNNSKTFTIKLNLNSIKNTENIEQDEVYCYIDFVKENIVVMRNDTRLNINPYKIYLKSTNRKDFWSTIKDVKIAIDATARIANVIYIFL